MDARGRVAGTLSLQDQHTSSPVSMGAPLATALVSSLSAWVAASKTGPGAALGVVFLTRAALLVALTPPLSFPDAALDAPAAVLVETTGAAETSFSGETALLLEVALPLVVLSTRPPDAAAPGLVVAATACAAPPGFVNTAAAAAARALDGAAAAVPAAFTASETVFCRAACVAITDLTAVDAVGLTEVAGAAVLRTDTDFFWRIRSTA